MYHGKRKYSSKGKKGRSYAKRGKGSNGAYFNPARTGYSRKDPRNLSFGGAASQVVIRQPTGLPDRLYVKLRYREQLSFTTLGGAVADNVYRGNSIFDPDLTGTGGQPLGFDQWAAFYATYTVLGSSCEVTGMMNSGATAYNCRQAIVPNIFSSQFGVTDQERILEQPYCASRVLTMGAAGVGQSTIKMYMSTNKIYGVVRPAVQIEDGYGALVTTNPTDTWFWHVCNWVPGGSTQSLIQDVVLTYWVVFEGRNVLAVS